MATRVGSRMHGRWRAVDAHGPTLTVGVQARRDAEAAERCVRRLLAGAGAAAPARITTDTTDTTDTLGRDAAVLARRPELVGAERVPVRANRALHMAVIVRLRYGGRTRAYVQRRVQEGRTKREAIRCLTRYVVRDVFRTLRADLSTLAARRAA